VHVLRIAQRVGWAKTATNPALLVAMVRNVSWSVSVRANHVTQRPDNVYVQLVGLAQTVASPVRLVDGALTAVITVNVNTQPVVTQRQVNVSVSQDGLVLHVLVHAPTVDMVHSAFISVSVKMVHYVTEETVAVSVKQVGSVSCVNNSALLERMVRNVPHVVNVVTALTAIHRLENVCAHLAGVAQHAIKNVHLVHMVLAVVCHASVIMAQTAIPLPGRARASQVGKEHIAIILVR
jgi:hypothetical protein